MITESFLCLLEKDLLRDLKTLRTEHNLSQNDVAKALNLTRGTVTHWESEIRLPGLEIAIKLVDYFNVSLDYLVGRSDNPELK